MNILYLIAPPPRGPPPNKFHVDSLNLNMRAVIIISKGEPSPLPSFDESNIYILSATTLRNFIPYCHSGYHPQTSVKHRPFEITENVATFDILYSFFWQRQMLGAKFVQVETPARTRFGQGETRARLFSNMPRGEVLLSPNICPGVRYYCHPTYGQG